MLREYDNVKEKNPNKKQCSFINNNNIFFSLILPYSFDIIRQILYPLCQHNETTKKNLQQFHWAVIIMESYINDKNLEIIIKSSPSKLIFSVCQ